MFQRICPFPMIKVIALEGFFVPFNAERVICGHHFLQFVRFIGTMSTAGRDMQKTN